MFRYEYVSKTQEDMMALVITPAGWIVIGILLFGMVVIVVGFLITRYSSIAEPQDAQKYDTHHIVGEQEKP